MFLNFETINIGAYILLKRWCFDFVELDFVCLGGVSHCLTECKKIIQVEVDALSRFWVRGFRELLGLKRFGLGET